MGASGLRQPTTKPGWGKRCGNRNDGLNLPNGNASRFKRTEEEHGRVKAFSRGTSKGMTVLVARVALVDRSTRQAETFVLNVESEGKGGYVGLGGHGFDGTLECGLVRCPEYDQTYVANLGKR